MITPSDRILSIERNRTNNALPGAPTLKTAVASAATIRLLKSVPILGRFYEATHDRVLNEIGISRVQEPIVVENEATLIRIAASPIA